MQVWTAKTQVILGLLSRFILVASLAYITLTYAGHMSIRVHRRTRDLRSDLDKGAAGNTCRIVKAHLFKSARKAASSYVPA